MVPERLTVYTYRLDGRYSGYNSSEYRNKELSGWPVNQNSKDMTQKR